MPHLGLEPGADRDGHRARLSRPHQALSPGPQRRRRGARRGDQPGVFRAAPRSSSRQAATGPLAELANWQRTARETPAPAAQRNLAGGVHRRGASLLIIEREPGWRVRAAVDRDRPARSAAAAGAGRGSAVAIGSAALDGPLDESAIARSIDQAVGLAERGDVAALADKSRDCHRRMRAEPELRQLDRCAAFDDAVAALGDMRADDGWRRVRRGGDHRAPDESRQVCCRATIWRSSGGWTASVRSSN